MNIAFLIGRIIFAAFWLMSAFNHFTKLNYMSGYAQAKGVPYPKLAVAGTGVLLLLGGASVLLGVCPTVGIILLIVFMLGTTFTMHNFWTVSDPQMKQGDMINFLKKLGDRGSAAHAVGHTPTLAGQLGKQIVPPLVTGRFAVNP
jgi:putative oxidoreductase